MSCRCFIQILADYPRVLIFMNKDKFPNKHAENGCFLAGQQTGIFIICHLTKVFLLYVDINYANVHNLTSQIKEVLRLVFLRFCVSLCSLVTATFFQLFASFACPFFILILRRDTHILLLLFSVLHGHILYQSICKKGRRIRFGIKIDIE